MSSVRDLLMAAACIDLDPANLQVASSLLSQLVLLLPSITNENEKRILKSVYWKLVWQINALTGWSKTIN
ncbi:hypothetical protein CL6EHI_154580 [Entamoeba histolytica]|uniref:Uncharacterized protein n=2 Tax=Entamoeba histolytica TaxID=5759 RepID=B1N4W1_ENTH1|nr:hypothetical protein EHI_154580 [Entamoeba histolytica HM-1:IMSS]EDS88997.1 hypothetical protein EHI_154580 [Entamoeba histolytica HM-1:IMSS]GAT98956.1 hypothetical protein CL6EHI_154580 [Entamoeba histolytica]|eukprot:XP_001914227.1 hypothetical protein EHI_154580 [Entamoeba histolytica HM-1:IMSS]